MGHPYLCSAVGGAHRREYHGGGTVTKFKLANDLASCTASAAAAVKGKAAGNGGQEEVNYTPASPKKGAYTGFSSEVMFGGS